ncbi:hypothetical protein [Microbacterium candidum]|uniref:DUF4406 domain-containing protein n=1 Tax=Microbacterium candidum TaxID=3041922 RepID=A0ABT7MVH1_9MICO|nr:hypothetical protein [Microbacterium sp. ASV49]MDL9978420.1 hypothetical protein [Microbacterium sp. ASV49]
MTPSDDDLREYSLVLVGHGLLNPLPGAEPGTLDRARALVRWAAEHGHGLYQLPVAGYRLAESSDAAGRRRMAREDAASLRFVFSQLREYLDAGYRLSALVLEPADTAGASGRAWLRRLGSAAEAEEISLPQPMIPGAILAAPAD